MKQLQTNRISFILFLASTFFCQCEQHIKEQDPISKVENNILSSVQFADSSISPHSIYDRMKFYNISSVSVAVINNGKIEWAKTYGLADFEAKRQADTNTLYQAASMSKSINVLCIMKLVQEGKLSLDKDIREYLKTWKFPENEFSKNKKITLKNLLSHTAGLSVHGFAGYSFGDTIPSINEMLDGKHPANSEAVKSFIAPNTKVEYSGGGIVLTRKILADNISNNYDSLMEQIVFNPLSMHNSSFSQPLKSTQQNFATAYDINGKEIKGKYHIYPEQSPDGLWTTPTDMAKFIIAVQQSLKNINASILNKTMIKTMLSPILDSSSAALGCFIEDKGGEKYFSHGGSNEGYKCYYCGSFSTGVGVVVMVNSDVDALCYEIVNSVATAYNWKGDFFSPITKKLFVLPDKTANKYIGEYNISASEYSLKIIVRKSKSEGLEMKEISKGLTRVEKMYFTSENTFFTMLSPEITQEFVSSTNTSIDQLIIKDGSSILDIAKRK